MSNPLGMSLVEQLDLLRPGTADALTCALAPLPNPLAGCATQVALPISTIADNLADPDLVRLAVGVPNAGRARRLSWIAGRLCAELALRAEGCPWPLVGHGHDGEPSWPVGWTGSISHNSDLAVAIAGRYDRLGPVGLDVEAIVDDATREALVSLCLTPGERIRGHGTSNFLATLLFSTKEAYYKAVFPSVRRFIDFGEVELEFVDLATGLLVLRPIAGTGLPVMHGRYFACGDLVLTWVSGVDPPRILLANSRRVRM